ncbi:hypothetical protein Pint_18970 [Pistacia integerrima]|uniref:Uncharacterized protein n=1 Tax=Pistacia integerrima TaxID=434235 RepID=A0ACC0Z183_9ROSI|nr:hypothetical protein Pint_18970 [Pistacia integerrima]
MNQSLCNMTPSRYLLPIILSVLFTIAAAGCNNGKFKVSVFLIKSFQTRIILNLSTSMPSWTTHNSYAIEGEPSRTGHTRLTPTNQEDSITKQLKNGVRALMLDPYDFRGDVWLCHGLEGICQNYTAFMGKMEYWKMVVVTEMDHLNLNDKNKSLGTLRTGLNLVIMLLEIDGLILLQLITIREVMVGGPFKAVRYYKFEDVEMINFKKGLHFIHHNPQRNQMFLRHAN